MGRKHQPIVPPPTATPSKARAASPGPYLSFDRKITTAGLAALTVVLGAVAYTNRPHQIVSEALSTPDLVEAAAATVATPTAALGTAEPVKNVAPAVAEPPATRSPEVTMANSGTDQFDVNPQAARFVGKNLVVDFEIKNRRKHGPSEGRAYGVATFVANDGHRIFIESHPGASQALTTGTDSGSGPIGESYKARLSTKKSLLFPVPERTAGGFTLVSLAVKDAHAARAKVTPVALEVRAPAADRKF